MSSGKFPAEYYKDMVVNRYFGKVDRKVLGGVLRNFHSGCGLQYTVRLHHA